VAKAPWASNHQPAPASTFNPFDMTRVLRMAFLDLLLHAFRRQTGR
jgi:hypothetical protein